MPLGKLVTFTVLNFQQKGISYLLVTTANTILWAILQDLKESKEVLKKLFERVKTLERKSVFAYNPFKYKNTLFTTIRLRFSNSLFEY